MSKKNKSRKKKVVNIISIVLYIIFLLLTLGLFGIVINLGILPLKYLIPLIIIVGLLYFGIAKVVFSKKLKIWVKIIIDFVCLILLGLILFIYYYLNSTLHFMDKIMAGDYQTEEYYVLVEKNSKYDNLEDINSIGIYKTQTKEYKEALNKLKESATLKQTKFDSYAELSNALFENEIDSMLISSSYKQIVSEMIENFDNKVKIIHIIEIKLENGIKASDLNITKDSFNVYISGIDIYGDINSISRSDVNMIATINPKTHDILLTSIPRDYYVQLHDTIGSKDKLTHAGMYGVDMSINTIEDLLDIEIDYYVRVNFTTLINLVDAVGGIDVYSDTAFTAYTDGGCHYQVGMMHLDGRCALAYSRERMSYIDGDRHRVRNQQDVIAAIMTKALSSRTLITKYTNILESLGSSFQTNIPQNNIYDLINMQLEYMPKWVFSNYSLNGYDSSNGTYTFGDQQLYVMEPDYTTVTEATNKINNILKNKK